MVIPITILCLGVCFFVCYLAYMKEKEISKYNKLSKQEINNIKLYMIDYAYDDYKNNLSVSYEGFRKYSMFETMNKNMTILKSCLQQLIYEGIIEEKNDIIKITQFGKNYYEKILRK